MFCLKKQDWDTYEEYEYFREISYFVQKFINQQEMDFKNKFYTIKPLEYDSNCFIHFDDYQESLPSNISILDVTDLLQLNDSHLKNYEVLDIDSNNNNYNAVCISVAICYWC